MKIKILTTIICLVAALEQYAQTIIVKDKTSLQRLQDVQVNNLKTDAKGQVDFSAVEVDKLNSLYRVSKEGYYSDSFTATQLSGMNYEVLLNERSIEFNGVVISASKFEEESRDVAQQSTVLSRKSMEFANQSNTADLLLQSGRVFIQKSQMGGGSVAMRGFEANKVLMVVDGVRMNNAIYRGGHLQNVITVDNNMLEKTELLFGPGSVVYGSDALGGVVHFYTKNPLLSNSDKMLVKAMALVRYGSAMQEKTGHADFNIGLKKFAFLTSFTYSDFGDMTIGKRGTKNYESWGRRTFYSQRFGNKDSMVMNPDSFKQIPTGYTQMDFMEKILFRQNNSVSHLLNIQYSNSSDVPRYDRLTEKTGAGLPSQAQWYYGPQKRAFISYKASVNASTAAFDRYAFIIAYQDIEESRHNRGFGSANITRRTEKVKVKTLNFDFEKEVGSRTELRYGVELTDNDVQSTAFRENVNNGSNSAQSTRYPDGGSVMRSSAVYITQSTYMSPRFVLNTGIRFTHTYLKSVFKDKTFFPFLGDKIEQSHQNTSGNIGLVYQGPNDLKISANVATGFRAPNVDDIAKVFESGGGRVIVPNPNLKPEQTTNIDLIVSKTFVKKFNIEASVFYTKFSNALTYGRAQLNGKDTVTFNGTLSTIYSLQNAQNAYVYGYYAGVNFDVSKKVSINGSINYTYGRIKTDSTDYPLDHISPVFGRLGVIFKHRKLKAEFFTVFNGAKKSEDYNLLGEDNQLYSADPVKGFNPAWYTLNIRGYYQFNNFLQVQLAVENIMDQHYRTFSSGYSAAGRNIMLTLRGNF
jgi:hemoglobin/transferrin/lactoferrin receptor protein